MIRSWSIGLLAATLICQMTWTPGAWAEGNTSDSSKLKQIQEDKKQAEKKVDAAQAELNEAKAKVDQIEKEIGQIEDQITEQTLKLQASQKELNKKQENFHAVITRMYQKGQAHYLSFVLSADSFDDFLARFEMVRMILKREKNVLDEYKKTQQDIEKQIQAIEQKKKEKEPYLKEAQTELANYTKVYNQHASQLKKLKHEEAVTKEAIERKNRAVRAANASGANYGTGELAWPQPGGTVTSPYGWRNGRMHEGIDIGNDIGSPILAADDGVVVLTKSDPDGYGYYVVIDHGNGLKTLYAHMYSSTVTVSVGERVRKGQRIASVGNNGRSTGPHLHFETHKNGTPVNPMQYY
ncbi:murein hydrolase activator EnvC family protein [Laceyella putida]|uniref:Murein hydrolase activator EnvC family protein n=1 Tax=Laceyella putida TaxID=110101 RepID=A0ABW2RG85_9BACL